MTMNDYTFSLIKEIAAQRAGYIPSPMWGRLVHTTDDEHKTSQYDILTHYIEPKHMPQKHFSPAHKDVIQYAHHIKDSVSHASDIKKDLLNIPVLTSIGPHDPENREIQGKEEIKMQPNI